MTNLQIDQLIVSSQIAKPIQNLLFSIKKKHSTVCIILNDNLPFCTVSSMGALSMSGKTGSDVTISIGGSVCTRSTLGSLISGTGGSGLVSALEVARLSEPSLLGRISSTFPVWGTPRPSAEPTALSTLGVDVLGLWRLGLFCGVETTGLTSPRLRGNVLARTSLFSVRFDVAIGWAFCRLTGTQYSMKYKGFYILYRTL